jgi:phosphoglycerol transferase MdoB-like AlkP superfamily enzyme
MNENTKTSINIGGGLGNMLFITFLVLKLTKVIDWSWWWVTSPLWIGLAIVLGIVLIVLVAFLAVEIVRALKK